MFVVEVVRALLAFSVLMAIGDHRSFPRSFSILANLCHFLFTFYLKLPLSFSN